MDVQEIQKINALAKELLKNHIVSSAEEAHQAAVKMVQKDINSPEFRLVENDGNRIVEPKKNERDLQEELGNINNKVNNLQMELVSIKSDFEKVREAMNSLKQQIMLEISTLKSRPDRGAMQSQMSQPEESQRAPPPPQMERHESSSEGKKGFTEKDVAIEKIFYFGK